MSAVTKMMSMSFVVLSLKAISSWVTCLEVGLVAVHHSVEIELLRSLKLIAQQRIGRHEDNDRTGTVRLLLVATQQTSGEVKRLGLSLRGGRHVYYILDIVREKAVHTHLCVVYFDRLCALCPTRSIPFVHACTQQDSEMFAEGIVCARRGRIGRLNKGVADERANCGICVELSSP
ncbi:hypothetical protein DFJ77DRAFT_153751 [Powellomyces hirtus]|nr:hypothetical protein DFJ77DRAFT_153751 [Powellomyces hirtus]